MVGPSSASVRRPAGSTAPVASSSRSLSTNGTAASRMSRPSSQPSNRASQIKRATIASSSTLNAAGMPTAEISSNGLFSQSNSQQRRRGDDEESNIHVVVRVRGRAPGEPRIDNSALTTSGPRSSQIHVALETSAAGAVPGSSVPVTEVPRETREKTYNFDQVFGPEADQGMVYQDVVTPVLAEVMSGYNCTIFAYGQTGTGKTHTMEGDLTSLMGTYSSEAGIIPRTLYRLFHTLELSKDEYSVRASFIELYNEELRDLGSLEGTSSSASTSTAPTSSSALRMFDDARGKGGITIHGLEEMPLRDAEDGLKLLRRGSQKRQIAATRCNEQSSRSHSVFTLTVHIKETSAKGEDVLRTGKLNLVDLAGSENIGRSGAINGRAREAGMINQSLLTLGRVINSLVEKSSHVPYRESKLTRLLQDSLGGRTKTSIIATVSADRSNIEETLSTLDYALRAKSIKNKPELNQRMTRTALIKEYVHEIERLKGDLFATREKNGIFVSAESWKQTQDELEANRRGAELARQEVELTESKLNSLKEQFEQNLQLLVKREFEVKTVRDECSLKAEEVNRLETTLASSQQDLEQEIALRKRLAENESRLDSIAKELRATAASSTEDLSLLFAKLERKAGVERANHETVEICRTSLASMIAGLEAKLVDFRGVHDKFSSRIKTRSQALTESSTILRDNLNNQSLTSGEALSGGFAAFSQAADRRHEETQEKLTTIQATAVEIRREIILGISTLAEDIREERRGVIQATRTQQQTLGQIFDRLNSLFVDTIQEATSYLVENAKSQEASNTLVVEAAQQEIAALRRHNEVLTKLLSSEMQKAASARDSVIACVSSLLHEQVAEQEQRFAETHAQFRAELLESETRISTSVELHRSLGMEAKAVSAALGKTFKETGKQVGKSATSWQKRISQADEDLDDKFGKRAASFDSAVESQTLSAGSRIGSLVENLTAVLDHANTDKVTQVKQVQELSTAADLAIKEMASSVSSSTATSAKICEELDMLTERQKDKARAFFNDGATQMSNLRGEMKTYLHERIVKDEQIGNTPRKRKWSLPEDWTLVGSTTSNDDGVELSGVQTEGSIVISGIGTRALQELPNNPNIVQIELTQQGDAVKVGEGEETSATQLKRASKRSKIKS